MARKAVRYELRASKGAQQKMKIEKPSQLLAVVAWASVFVEAWLLVLRNIPADGISWGFFAFFFLIAVASAAVSSNPVAK